MQPVALDRSIRVPRADTRPLTRGAQVRGRREARIYPRRGLAVDDLP